MKILDKVVDMVIEGLENGTVPWRKTWKDFMPMNAFSKREYKGFNSFMLNLCCANSNCSYPVFGTFKQISEAGGRVKKGEHSFPVVFWKVTNVTDKEKEKGEVGTEKTEKRFTPFYFNVFNLGQTEGIDIQKYIPAVPTKSNNPLETCETVIKNMPNPPKITHDKAGAFYMPLLDMVNVPEIRYFDCSQEYYAASFHELAHSTGHSTRLNRLIDNKAVFGKNSYNYEELVAEMTATYLCSHCGIEQTVENSIAYLTGWAKFLKTERKSTLFGAATKAQAATDYILGKPLENDKSEQVEEFQEITL